jgi:hypothetical protein
MPRAALEAGISARKALRRDDNVRLEVGGNDRLSALRGMAGRAATNSPTLLRDEEWGTRRIAR